MWQACDRTKLTTLRAGSRQFVATAPAFNLSHLHLSLRWGSPGFSFAEILCVRKLKCRVTWRYTRDPTFSRISRRPISNRRTDRHYVTRRQLASRGKKYCMRWLEHIDAQIRKRTWRTTLSWFNLVYRVVPRRPTLYSTSALLLRHHLFATVKFLVFS